MKKILLLLTCIVISCISFGQSYFYDSRYYDNVLLLEAGISAGGMNCLTDLGGKAGRGKPFFKDINWNCTRPAAGLYVGFLYQYSIGARLEVTIGKLTAADSLIGKNISDAVHRCQRNLHFRSKIAEVLLMIEFHPLSLLFNAYEFVPQVSPYIVAGVGLFSFHPKAQFQGKWISLQPLRTEGAIYQTTQLNFPAGAGLKYELSALLNARLEAVYRFLQTDHLDDVSGQYIDPALFYQFQDAATATLAAQLADRRRPDARLSSKRGNPRKNDAYFSFNLKLYLVLNRKRRP
jgi:opacity protein-like surface antigen